MLECWNTGIGKKKAEIIKNDFWITSILTLNGERRTGNAEGRNEEEVGERRFIHESTRIFTNKNEEEDFTCCLSQPVKGSSADAEGPAS
ncbi:MAG: hypothetical protein ACOCV7_02200 [Desulfonatronovibrionaceae bacterium]